MAYRADIEIGVRGAKELKTLTDNIKHASNAVQGLNDFVEALSGTVPKTFNNIASAVQEASRAFDQSISDTKEATLAANALVKAEAAYNQELKERNRLLETARAAQGPSIKGQRLTETQQQNRESLQAFFADAQQQAKNISLNATNTRTAWSTFFSEAEQLALDLQTSTSAKQAQIQRNWSVFFGDAAEVASDLQNAANARSSQIKLSWTKFFGDAAEVANDLQAATTARAGSVKQSWTRFFADAAEVAGDLQTAAEARSAQLNRNWNVFFTEAADLAKQLQANSAAKRLNVKASWAKFFSEAEQVAKELSATAATREAKTKLSWNRFFQDAETVARDLRLAANSDKAKIQSSWNKFFDEAEKIADDLSKSAKASKNKQKARAKDIAGSALIGGAFPLLFGQGVGAAAGGGLGGALGGAMGGQMGFALSLVGTQIGTFVDQIIAGAGELGQALNPLTADIEALGEAAGFAGTETAAALQTIEELGTKQQALEAATALLAATVGNQGVQALEDFGSDTADLGNEFARAMSLMQAAAARFFRGVPGFVANILKQANDLQAGLNLDSPEAKALQQRRSELLGVKEGAPQFGAGTGSAAAASSLSKEDFQEFLAIEQQLRELAQGKTAEAENQAKVLADQLTTTAFLAKFGAENTRLAAVQNKLAGTKKDFTNAEYVLLLKRQAAEQLMAANKKAEVEAENDLTGAIKANGGLKQVRANNLEKFNNRIAEIDRKQSEAIDRRSDKEDKAAQRVLDGQRKILEASQRNLKIQQSRFKALGAETASQRALLAFVSRKAEIERKANEEVKKAQEAGGPTAQAAVDNIRQAESVALAGERLRLEEAISKVIEGVNRPLDQIIEKNQDQLAFNAEYQELLSSGVTPELAKQLAQIEVIYEKSLDKLKAEIASLEAQTLKTKLSEEEKTQLQEQLDILRKQQEILEGKRGQAKETATKVEESKPGKIQAYMDQLQRDLNDTEGMIVSLAQTIEGEIGSAMSTAITNVITGTGTVQEAMSAMFANIGKAFIDMATQMIAKALVLKALGVLFPGGGGGGGGSMFPMDTGGWTAPEGATPKTLGMNFFKKANGGPVGPNGTYLVGEQGPELLSMGNQPGYVHRNTSEVMDRYRNGGNQGGTAANLSVNYNVTDINGMRFVTEDQFRAGMTKAAKDGAKMGEAGTFKTMKNSRSSRARVGL